MANPKTVRIQALCAHFAEPSVDAASMTVGGFVRVYRRLIQRGKDRSFWQERFQRLEDRAADLGIAPGLRREAVRKVLWQRIRKAMADAGWIAVCESDGERRQSPMIKRLR